MAKSQSDKAASGSKEHGRGGADTQFGAEQFQKLLGEIACGFKADKLVEESMNFYQELLKIATGASDLAADKRDRRFQDPAWSNNPFYKQLGQSYLAWSKALGNVTNGLDDWQTRERAKFATEIVTSAMAPTNVLPLE